MLGVPASPWGTQELGHPQRLMDCLLIEAVILLVGSMSFECSLMVLLAAFQAFSRAPTHRAHFSVLQEGREIPGLLLLSPAQMGQAGIYPPALTSPQG